MDETKKISPSFHNDDVKIIEHEKSYQGFFRIDKYLCQHRLFEGGWSNTLTREVFERGHSAAIILYDPNLDEVVLLEQFRIGALRDETSPWLIEIVAGAIDNEHETAKELISRETQEEAGLELLDSQLIYDYWVSPGGTSERLALFCGKVDASQAGGIHGLPHEDEDIRVFTCPVIELLPILTSGRINNGAAIVAVQWLLINHKKLRDQWKD